MNSDLTWNPELDRWADDGGAGTDDEGPRGISRGTTAVYKPVEDHPGIRPDSHSTRPKRGGEGQDRRV